MNCNRFRRASSCARSSAVFSMCSFSFFPVITLRLVPDSSSDFFLPFLDFFFFRFLLRLRSSSEDEEESSSSRRRLFLLSFFFRRFFSRRRRLLCSSLLSTLDDPFDSLSLSELVPTDLLDDFFLFLDLFRSSSSLSDSYLLREDEDFLEADSRSRRLFFFRSPLRSDTSGSSAFLVSSMAALSYSQHCLYEMNMEHSTDFEVVAHNKWQMPSSIQQLKHGGCTGTKKPYVRPVTGISKSLFPRHTCM